MNEKVVPAGGDRHRAPDENPLWKFGNFKANLQEITVKKKQCKGTKRIEHM